MISISLENKTAFVTGSEGGIGSTIVKVLQSSGATVITPSMNELNLSDINSINNYLSKYSDLKVDIFVHCAGINELAGINEISQNSLKRVFDVNFFSAIHLMKAFSHSMQKQKWGRVVFISSLYGIVSRERRIAYSSSKNALTGLCKSLAIELGGDNILLNCVAPGYVMTEMTRKNLSDEEIKAIEGQMPTGRFQTPEDIAFLTSFLCSDLNQSITGQLIAVDGGFICK